MTATMKSESIPTTRKPIHQRRLRRLSALQRFDLRREHLLKLILLADEWGDYPPSQNSLAELVGAIDEASQLLDTLDYQPTQPSNPFDPKAVRRAALRHFWRLNELLDYVVEYGESPFPLQMTSEKLWGKYQRLLVDIANTKRNLGPMTG